jgi:hypothetical protein
MYVNTGLKLLSRNLSCWKDEGNKAYICDGQLSVYKKRKLSIVMGQNLSCLFPGTFHIILYEHEQEDKGVMCEN